MTSDHQAQLPPNSPINDEIVKLGESLFKEIGSKSQFSLKRSFWLKRLMQWSMKRPEMKLNLFRLIDVFPSLRSYRDIERHVKEYLGDTAPSLMRLAIKASPAFVSGPIMSFAINQSVKQMAGLFIAGANPSESLKEIVKLRKNGLAFTMDLLGEYSISERRAEAYLERYLHAIEIMGNSSLNDLPRLIEGHPGESCVGCISIKLSALYSQISLLDFENTVMVISDRLSKIARAAQKNRVSIFIDAEDCGTNPVIYECFKRVFSLPDLRQFPYPGIVVQAYARSSSERVDELLSFARNRGAPIAIRLVKGAYWEHETLLSSQSGKPSPLFKHKESSDANFERLTRRLLDNSDLCLPGIASHNIRSLSHACVYAQSIGLGKDQYELQMLHGMAQPIALSFAKRGYLVRMYVPVGDLVSGMGYLVRRLLENTSNESFLRHTFYDRSRNVSGQSVSTNLLRAPEMID